MESKTRQSELINRSCEAEYSGNHGDILKQFAKSGVWDFKEAGRSGTRKDKNGSRGGTDNAQRRPLRFLGQVKRKGAEGYPAIC